MGNMNTYAGAFAGRDVSEGIADELDRIGTHYTMVTNQSRESASRWTGMPGREACER
jgi:hypothetical protein